MRGMVTGELQFPLVEFFGGRSVVLAPPGEASGSRVATLPSAFCPVSLLLLLLSLAFPWTAGFGSPTARAALQHVPMIQPIQHGGFGTAVEASARKSAAGR
jgi:hypothetical protein